MQNKYLQILTVYPYKLKMKSKERKDMEFDVEKERLRWALSDEEFEENVNEIFGELALTATPTEKPVYSLVGGQAGSGKSALVSKRYRELQGKAIIIDQDELRPKFPRDKYRQIRENYTERQEFLILNPYIAKIIRAIITRAKKDGYNIIVESALQDVDDFIRQMNGIREVGYRTELDILAVPELEANISMLTRYCYYIQKDGECRRNTRINPQATENIMKSIRKISEANVTDDIKVYVRGDSLGELPKQIYSFLEAGKTESPLEAFIRGKKESEERALRDFCNKYEEIERILKPREDTIQLEKLQQLKEQYLKLYKGAKESDDGNR